MSADLFKTEEDFHQPIDGDLLTDLVVTYLVVLTEDAAHIAGRKKYVPGASRAGNRRLLTEMRTPMRNPHAAARTAKPLLLPEAVYAAVSRTELAVFEGTSESIHRHYYILDLLFFQFVNKSRRILALLAFSSLEIQTGSAAALY